MGMAPLIALKTSQKGSNIEYSEPVWNCTTHAFLVYIRPTCATIIWNLARVKNEGEGYVGFVSLLTVESCPWHDGPTCSWILYPSLSMMGCLALVTTQHDSFHHFKGVSMLGHTKFCKWKLNSGGIMRGHLHLCGTSNLRPTLLKPKTILYNQNTNLQIMPPHGEELTASNPCLKKQGRTPLVVYLHP